MYLTYLQCEYSHHSSCRARIVHLPIVPDNLSCITLTIIHNVSIVFCSPAGGIAQRL